ncbi:MAG TPA: putative Ig domain-containing protein [Candidatus Limnocylindria bacterium]|nr:putative Ig domain-containing protein [Candidatus Limnocylindria bacterium]
MFRLDSGPGRRLIMSMVLVGGLVGCTQASFNVQPETLPNAAVGQPYEVLITATYPEGGVVDSKSLSTEGSFPPGLSLRSTKPSDRTAAIFGTPTVAGTYAFTLRVGGEYCTMAGCPFGTRRYTLVVTP